MATALASKCQAERAVCCDGVEDQGTEEALSWGMPRELTRQLWKHVSRASGSRFTADREADHCICIVWERECGFSKGIRGPNRRSRAAPASCSLAVERQAQKL